MPPAPWKRLTKLLPQPNVPKGLDRGWGNVEEEIGLSLPEDYKQFIDHYGTGLVCGAEQSVGYLGIWNYRDKNHLHSIPQSIASVTKEYQDARSRGYSCPYPLYPDTGSLLPFASTLNADYFNWLTAGPPHKWSVVFYYSSMAEFILLEDGTFVKVLLAILTHKSLLMPSRISPDVFSLPLQFTEVNW